MVMTKSTLFGEIRKRLHGKRTVVSPDWIRLSVKFLKKRLRVKGPLVKKIIRSVFGLLVFGPLLFSITACSSSITAPESAITLKAGEIVKFVNNVAGGPENGWSESEGGGTWSASDSTILNLEYDKSFNNGLDLRFSMASFVFEKNPVVSVTITANREFVKEIKFDLTRPSGDVLVNISKKILSKNKGWVILTFDITNAAVPNELGYNTDTRKLGIFLSQMIATPAT
jgi:hypothetical protein